MNPKISTVQIHKITADGSATLPDQLVREEPLEILLGTGAGAAHRRESLAVTMRTPGDDFELAAGFLFTEGIVAGADDIVSIRFVDENRVLVDLRPTLSIDFQQFKRNFYATSSCGVCGKASLDAVQTVACFRPIPGEPKVSRTVIFDLPEKLRAAQAAFEATGGLHAAGLFDENGRLILLREDVGRHNAVDKAIGAALRGGLSMPLSRYILLVSGRAGFELVQKASMAGLPMLAAVGAPSSLSVELAEASGMTLVGFLRGAKFNVYADAERII